MGLKKVRKGGEHSAIRSGLRGEGKIVELERDLIGAHVFANERSSDRAVLRLGTEQFCSAIAGAMLTHLYFCATHSIGRGQGSGKRGIPTFSQRAMNMTFQAYSYHYRGNAEGSTLRLTLGCLLSVELDTVLRRVRSGKRTTFGPQEARLGWPQMRMLPG